MKSTSKLYWSAVVIPFWLAIGVYVTGVFYPEYSHFNQAMSELGAIGSPVHSLSPLINNYPLAILFCTFGYVLIVNFKISKWVILSGLLIIIHGLSSALAGYFTCDIRCNLDSQLLSQSIHNWAGLVMFFSLLLANIIWLFLSKKYLHSDGFIIFSLLTALAAIGLLPFMAKAVEEGVNFGLYQRLNYAVQVVWLMVLALFLLRLRQVH
ncbi:DUF998 domain-containing protein [Pseudomonas sp. F1_0610]|uniref:DUF998 domain-containing protein n=1 Tax=Pseudomonas sp. F1_0610 TaxID=3114284 RepID=UPI0039C08354